MIPTVGTARLVLRPLAAGDAPAIVEALAHWQVSKWLARVPWPYTAGDAEAFLPLAAPGGAFEREGERVQALTLRGDDRVVGIVGLGAGPDPELGYWLAREAWGRGLVPEACRAVLVAHFAASDAPEITSGYFDGNARSESVLRRLGFADDGSERRWCLPRGEDVLSHRMRLMRAAFAPA